MTTHQFNDIAGRLRQGPWLWLFLAIFLALLVIGVGLFIEDFTTSLLGYEMWPTQKANPWVLWLVACLPQLGQVAFAYAWIDSKDPKFAIIVALCFFWDISTDVYFKSFAFQSPEIALMATFESVVLYSIGSEFLIAFSLGMLYAIWGYLKRQQFGMASAIPRGIPTPPPTGQPDITYKPRPRKR